MSSTTIASFRLLLFLGAFLLLFGAKSSAQVYVDYTSANGYKVLQPTFGNAIHSPDKTVEDVTITNGQNAYYYVHLAIQGSGPNSSSLPDYFILTPNEARTFPAVTFYGGDSVAFQADGTFNHPEVAFYEAGEVMFQVLFQEDLPTDIGDVFTLLLKQSASGNLQADAAQLGTALTNGDPSGAADKLLDIANSDEVRAFLKNNEKVQAFLTKHNKQLGPITGTQKLAFYKAAFNLAKFGIGGLVAAYLDAQYDTLTINGTQLGPTGGVHLTSSAAAPLYAPVDINLDASTSKGAGGTGISSYAWSLDGTPVSSAPAYDHVYWDAGTHTVKCTATDVNAHQYSVTSTLDITAPPILVTGYNAGQRSATFATVPNALLKSTGGYTWDWGDGSPQTVRDTADPISHTFAGSQLYTVTLTRHTRGNTNIVSTATVDYTPHPTNIYGGTLSGDQEWDASGNPYIIHGSLTIPAGVTLTLGPGVVLQFTFDSGLTILGDLRGPSSGAPAILTSPRDASPYGGADQAESQDWPGIVYGAGLTANLQNITIKHARYGLSADSATLTRCIFTQNSTGVSVSNGGGVYRNCTFTQNGVAVQNSSTVDVDARGNWWGDPSGPYNAKNNPNGRGNPVSDHVIVSGFLFSVPSLSGLTHILWTNTDGTASLWNYDVAGGTFTQNAYGPYPGWSAKAVADGGTDGRTRLLWNNTSGAMSLWSLDNSTGQFTQYSFGPYPGWTAKTISVGPDNTTHVLWASTSGAASVWNYSTDTGGFTQHSYGPYPGWVPVALADGANGKTRMIWGNYDGRESFWNLDSGSGSFTQNTFGPYPGWTANALSVSADGVTHIMWDDSTGQMSLWNYDPASGGFTQHTSGPYSGWTATGLADGADGKTRLLWTNGGIASLWNYNDAANSFTQFTFGPYAGWSAIGISAAP